MELIVMSYFVRSLCSRLLHLILEGHRIAHDGYQSHAALRHIDPFRCERKFSPTFHLPCRLHRADGFQHHFVLFSPETSRQCFRSGGFPNPPAVSIRICNLIVSAHHRCLYSPQPDSCVPSVASDQGRATNPAERIFIISLIFLLRSLQNFLRSLFF